ncbi:SPOR domain-containing protein [Fulvimarina sp. MAC3]|uniref:SPOR domain-containing protein n=1 Tax=Fulvimarina sp. MAC3 TaxID=3148887 RepID=UPI0031FD1EBA
MDDRSAAGRGFSEFADTHEDDPFAELAKLIEEPWGAPVAKPAPKANPAPKVESPRSQSAFDQAADGEPALDTTLSQSDISQSETSVEDPFAQAGPAQETIDDASEGVPATYDDPYGLEALIASEMAEPVEASDETVADHSADQGIASELKTANEQLPEAREAVSADQPDFGLDGLIASELDAELASFAETIEAEAPAPTPAAVQAVPAKPAARPHFGAAMFSQAAKTAKPQAKTPEEPVLEPLTVAADKKSEASSADDGFDAEFALALEGLSAPADPLAGKVRKTEAFAPERKVEDEKVEPVFDDFDSLLASEMATLNLDKKTEPVSIAEPSQAHAVAPETEIAVEDEAVYEEPLPRILSTFSRNAAAVDAPAEGRARAYGSPYRKIAAGLVGVALLGGASVFVLGGSNESSGSSEPLIVRAETDPIKIAPPNPGGRQVANQHRVTYEKVANADSDGGARQESLLSAAEKPIALQQEAPESYENLPGVQSSAFAVAMSDAKPESSEPTLQPRRVRTVTVLPDGTIVTNKETESIEPTKALIDAASRPLDAGQTLGGITSASALNDEATLAGTADLAAIEAMTDGDDAGVVGSDTAAEIAGEPAPNVPVPSMKPTAPQRPREVASLQSNEQTGSIAAPSVSAAPAAAAPSADAWYVQMSSQPTAEAAQASAKTVASRYGNVISGRQLVVQTADIPGKGTYHRVRLAASSKQEAINLCEQMKSAGGSCYVSR